MSKATRNVASPYDDDNEFDVPFGTHDEDDRGDEDGATYFFGHADDFDDAMHFYFQGGGGSDEFVGGNNSDTIKGGKGVDTLHGGEGDDQIYGGADGDHLFGGGGQDELFGEDGYDYLNGGPQNDSLVGGAGADDLMGGSGSDDFVFIMDNLFNPDSPGSNPDTIWDFNASDGDRIVLLGSELLPGSAGYVAQTIDDAGYDAALSVAKTLLAGDKTHVFLTDGVDGYLFMEPWAGDVPAVQTVGIKLLGLTSVSDFQWYNIATDIY